ncbi:MAG: indolepyruvate oxidoreductase subunit beta [Victivallales bacterium]|nr:indolepyruvate oxidoreductase subunit beta [Victivallales bacterium]
MQPTTSILMCGVGGQGILLASEITARAAIEAGFCIKTNEVHGMAQRGGSVVACVRFGSEVHSPLIEPGSASILLALEPVEALRCHQYLSPEGTAVVSTQQVIPITVSSGAAQYPDIESALPGVFPRLRLLDAPAMAAELGEPRAANLVLLGGIAANLPQIPREAWNKAITACVKPKSLEVNLKAFEAGFAACAH